MTTHRASNAPNAQHADLGAQYITLSNSVAINTDTEDHSGAHSEQGDMVQQLCNTLVSEGVLQRFNGNELAISGSRGGHESQSHYTSPSGLSAVSKWFLKDAHGKCV